MPRCGRSIRCSSAWWPFAWPGPSSRRCWCAPSDGQGPAGACSGEGPPPDALGVSLRGGYRGSRLCPDLHPEMVPVIARREPFHPPRCVHGAEGRTTCSVRIRRRDQAVRLIEARHDPFPRASSARRTSRAVRGLLCTAGRRGSWHQSQNSARAITPPSARRNRYGPATRRPKGRNGIMGAAYTGSARIPRGSGKRSRSATYSLGERGLRAATHRSTTGSRVDESGHGKVLLTSMTTISSE